MVERIRPAQFPPLPSRNGLHTFTNVAHETGIICSRDSAPQPQLSGATRLLLLSVPMLATSSATKMMFQGRTTRALARMKPHIQTVKGPNDTTIECPFCGMVAHRLGARAMFLHTGCPLATRCPPGRAAVCQGHHCLPVQSHHHHMQPLGHSIFKQYVRLPPLPKPFAGRTQPLLPWHQYQ